MLWLLLALAVVTAAACYWHSRRRLYQLAREIPSGLKAYAIIGHAYLFVGTSEDRMKGLQIIGQKANHQGGLSHIWLANRLFIVMTDAKDIAVVSKTCLDKDEFTIRFTRTLTGYGSAFAPVNIWYPRRKMISPFFRMMNLRKIVKLFDKQSNIMTQLMQSESNTGDFPLWKYFTTYTLDTVFETAMGTKINSQINGDHEVLGAVQMATSTLAARLLQPWLHPDCVYKWLPVYKQFLQQKQILYDLIDETIRKKRKEFSTIESNSEGAKEECPTTFLDMLIQSSGGENGHTDLELSEEALQLVVAGNDTSAAGSCFTAVMLSRHPDVQDKVYQELLEVFGDFDRAVTPEDLSRLKYLEAVIKETLRLYPPVPAVVREVHNDVNLPSGTILVDGTSVVLHIWGTHRNPAYWGADADQFRPERFLEGPLPHSAMFIPFSYSARNCIGANYAMLSTNTALANLLRRYRLLPPANMAAADLRRPLRVRFDISMKAVDNFVVRIEERNK